MIDFRSKTFYKKVLSKTKCIISIETFFRYIIPVDNFFTKILAISISVAVLMICGCADKEYKDEKTGIVVKELGSDLNNRWALKGVIVESVMPGSPADKLIGAGELVSYIIDERKIDNEKEFKNILEDALHEDEKAILRISKAILASNPDDLGIKVGNDPEDRGVIVNDLKKGGKAQKAGIKLNTIIYTINDKPVRNVNDYNAIITNELQKGKVTLNIAREIVAPKLRKTGFDDVENGDGGVIVKKLEVINAEGSPASMEGIKEGDLITHVIDEMKIEDIKSYKKSIGKADDADRVIFRRGDLGGIKLTIIDALGEIGDVRAVEQLLKALESNDRWIRRSAANALKEMNDVRIVQPLLWHIIEANEPDPEVRRSAVEALARMKPLEAIEPLAQALRDSSLGVRLLAGHALGRIGEPATNVLIQARQDPDSKIRDIAVATLGKIVDNEGRSPQIVKNELKSVLQDKNEESTVKLTAIQSLYKIGDPDSIAELRKTAASEEPAIGAFINELLATAPAKL